MRSAGRTALAVCVFLAALKAEPAAAQEWTRFRGPNGSGLSEARTVPARWDEDDFNWRVRLPGKGHSSPVLWGERIFLTAGDEETGTRFVLCRHAEDGRVLWSRRFDSPRHGKHQLNSFASATPAVDRERVYLLWTTPEESAVQALDHDGETVWKTSLGPFKAGHGGGVSPIVYEGMVVVAGDQQGESSLSALDAASGEIRWQVPRETKVAYATPCVYRRPGRPDELIFTSWLQGITAINPADGRTNWQVRVFDPEHTETSIGSPIVADGNVLGTCGWLGYATHTVAVRPPDEQTGEPRVVYRVDRGAPLTTTPVAADGLLFLWADNGIVSCRDAETGRRVWRKRVGGKYYGSPVVVDGKVYCLSTGGKAVVLAASKDDELIARNPLGEGSHSTPAVAGGTMYLRTFSHLISLGGR